MAEIAGLRIDRIELVERGRLKAFVDINLGWLGIDDFRVVEKADGTLGVSHPKRLIEAPDGRPHYKAALRMSDERQDQVNAFIVAAYQAERAKQEAEGQG